MNGRSTPEDDGRALGTLGGHRYLRLTTRRKNGEQVPTPVWFALVGDLAYVFTDVESGKAKRIRANPRVTLAPGDWRGRPRGASLPATARFVDEAEEAFADRALREKYGWQYALAQTVLGLLGKSEQHAFLELRRSAGGNAAGGSP